MQIIRKNEYFVKKTNNLRKTTGNAIRTLQLHPDKGFCRRDIFRPSHHG